MKGWLNEDAWSITDTGGHHYLAERFVDDKHEGHEFKSHCLACAKTNVLSRYGGRVDTRGWHRQGSCGAFMMAMALVVEQEKEGEK